MDLLPDTQNCGLRMRWGCRERFPRYRLQRKPPVSDPGMHHGITHVPWCMPGSLTRGGGENVPGIPGACTTRNFAYLARGPWDGWYVFVSNNTDKTTHNFNEGSVGHDLRNNWKSVYVCVCVYHEMIYELSRGTVYVSTRVSLCVFPLLLCNSGNKLMLI